MVGEVGGDGEGEPPTSPLDAAVAPVTAADAGLGSTGLGNAGEGEGLVGKNATGRLCGLDGDAPCTDMYRNQYTENQHELKSEVSSIARLPGLSGRSLPEHRSIC